MGFPGLRVPDSVVFEALHAFLQNTAKMLIRMFGAGPDSQPAYGEKWHISAAHLKEIKTELQSATATIPSSFGVAPHDIWSSNSYSTAEDIMMFLTLYGPIILANRLPEEYYLNFVEYGRLVAVATAVEISEEDRVRLKCDMSDWVQSTELYVFPFTVTQKITDEVVYILIESLTALISVPSRSTTIFMRPIK